LRAHKSALTPCGIKGTKDASSSLADSPVSKDRIFLLFHNSSREERMSSAADFFA